MRFLALITVFLSAAPGGAKPCLISRSGAAAMPYAAGEELSYRMEVAGVLAGRAHLRLGALERTPYGVGYPIRADVETNAYAAFATELAGRFLSVMDPRTAASRFYRSSLARGGKTVEDRAVINGSSLRFEYHSGSRRKTGSLATKILIDPLVTLFGMRDLRLQKGDPVCLPMYSYRRVHHLRGSVIGLEQIDTVVGPVQAWRVELTLRRGKHRYPVRLWVGVSADRPLWRAELVHPKGTLVAILDRHIIGRVPIIRL
jgi:hypothetical protein